MRDGNPDGHPADKGLWQGVARLMGQRVDVWVTQRPSRIFAKSCDLEDANDVLRAHGVDGVRKLLATASPKPDELNVEMLLDGLSRLDKPPYDHARKQAAKKLDVRLGTLDDDRKNRRQRRAEAMADDVEEDTDPDDLPWPDPVTDIGEVLDAAVERPPGTSWRRRHLRHHGAMVVRRASAPAHRPRHRHCAKAGIPGPDQTVRKDDGAELAYGLSPRAKLYSSISTSSLFRMIDDEAIAAPRRSRQPAQRREKTALMAILNSGHQRSTANVENGGRRGRRLAAGEVHDVHGDRIHRYRKLLETLQDRSIGCYLRRATLAETHERLRDGRTEILIECRRKFSAGPQIVRPADVQTPGSSRTGSATTGKPPSGSPPPPVANGRNERWPPHGRPSPTRRRRRNTFVALLNDIWTIFHEKPVTKMHTDELVDAMKALDEGRWRRANGNARSTPTISDRSWHRLYRRPKP